MCRRTCRNESFTFPEIVSHTVKVMLSQSIRIAVTKVAINEFHTLDVRQCRVDFGIIPKLISVTTLMTVAKILCSRISLKVEVHYYH